MKRFSLQTCSLINLLCLLSVCGCFFDYSKSNSSKAEANADAESILIGSWNDKSKTRFMEITKGGSVVINEKGSSEEEIGFFEIDGSDIKIFKNSDKKNGRTEIAHFEIISDHEILFGQNRENWNVVNISGRWYRQGTDVEQVIARQKYEKLSKEEQHLVDIKKKKRACEDLIGKLQTDRKSYLIKLANINEDKNPESWKLNASMLAATKQRLRDADYELEKLKRAEEALEVLVADQARSQDIKNAGLDDEGLKKLLLSIGETENKLPIKQESDLELRFLVEEELKSLKKQQPSENRK